jgi:hypothetical protein
MADFPRARLVIAGGFTVRSALCDPPLTEAVIELAVTVATVLALTLKEPAVEPLGTITFEGIVTLLEFVDRAIMSPPIGAGPLSFRFPVQLPPL